MIGGRPQRQGGGAGDDRAGIDIVGEASQNGVPPLVPVRGGVFVLRRLGLWMRHVSPRVLLGVLHRSKNLSILIDNEYKNCADHTMTKTCDQRRLSYLS